jgi:hypothetical protein
MASSCKYLGSAYVRLRLTSTSIKGIEAVVPLHYALLSASMTFLVNFWVILLIPVRSLYREKQMKVLKFNILHCITHLIRTLLDAALIGIFSQKNGKANDISEKALWIYLTLSVSGFECTHGLCL